MADRGEIVSLESGILLVRVQDPVWFDQMISMRSVLQHDLARIAAVKLTAIHFERKR
jgi:hypothetical protein